MWPYFVCILFSAVGSCLLSRKLSIVVAQAVYCCRASCSCSCFVRPRRGKVYSSMSSYCVEPRPMLSP